MSNHKMNSNSKGKDIAPASLIQPIAPGRPQFGLVIPRALGNLIGQIFRRRAVFRLQKLSDHLLEDIGVTRAEVDAVMRLPLSQDAGAELSKLSQKRLSAGD